MATSKKRKKRSARAVSERGSAKSRKGKKKFSYTTRDKESAQRRAKGGGGLFDQAYQDEFNLFRPSDGDNLIRILPPTWEDADHCGYDTFMHYSVGPDKQSYLCAKRMKDEPCPICEEESRAKHEGDEEYAKSLRAKQRVLFWVIDRNKPQDGPLIYPMAWTMDRDLNAVCVDKESGEILEIDHPDDGYDVSFTKTGTGRNTEYTGVTPGRRAKPIARDEEQQEEWLEYVSNHPLPGTLNFFSYDHILEQFSGAADSRETEEDDLPATRSRKRGSGKKPAAKKKPILKVGSRVSAEIDGETYEGEIVSLPPKGKSALVEFDDGDQDTIKLTELTLLDSEEEASPPKKARGRKSSKTSPRSEEEEEEEEDEDEPEEEDEDLDLDEEDEEDEDEDDEWDDGEDEEDEEEEEPPRRSRKRRR